MYSAIVSLLALTAVVSAAPAKRADSVNWVDSGSIASWGETLLNDPVGNLISTYKPYLKVVTGCVPFPAVSAAGDVDAGLQPTGMQNGDCDSSDGQVYARADTLINQHFGIMYSWYAAKNQNADLSPSEGHRHDWQHIVVYFKEDPTTSAIKLGPIGVSFASGLNSATYTKLKVGAEIAPVFEADTHVLVQYDNGEAGDGMHVISSTSDVGGQQNVVQWEAMTPAAQVALSTADFGVNATVPFIDAHFDDILMAAWDDTFLG